MPTELRIIEKPTGDDVPSFYWQLPEWWGCMWRMPDDDLPDRKAWFIVLPNGAGGWTTTDHSSLREPGGYGKGPLWDVSGTAPKITVRPSIDASPEWHGWINDGVMTP